MKSTDGVMPAASVDGTGPGFLAGGGEMGALIRGYDWSQTPLDVPERWPQSLKTAIRIMLTSRQPIWIGWGADLRFFYNDPYKAIVGGRHPVALGQPTARVWHEIWSEIEPLLATAMTGVEGTFDEQKLLIMERNGYPEETYYTFSYSPIPDDQGGTGGIICANSDDTERVVAERQLSLLRELAASTANARTWSEACDLGMRALQTDPYDIPFALLYLAERGANTLTLAGNWGISPDHAAAPPAMSVAQDAPWPFEEALRTGATVLVDDLAARFAAPLPGGAWTFAPRQAAVLPVLTSGETSRCGVLVVGLNPCRLFGDRYRAFLDLAAGQIGQAISYAHAYEEERRRAEALAEIDRAKTAFFSNISHEFRTPLTLILGPLEELLARPSREGDADRELLAITHRNGLRLLKLVNTLLDFSRIESGRVQMQPQPTDLPAFTAELASLFRSAIEAAGLQLIVDCDPLDGAVAVDRDMWETIVLNLLSNAFKFTYAGAIVVSVRANDAGDVELHVCDSGIGIPEAEIPRVFERFHRVAGAVGRSIEGSGIGLALVQELVRLHGGSIRVESQPGEGTRFIITLPHATQGLASEPAPAPALTSKQAQAYIEAAIRWMPAADVAAGGGTSGAKCGATSGATAAANDADVVPAGATPPDSGASAVWPGNAAGGPARVLVVDDNADLRDYMDRILRAAGHEVVVAADGREALDAARVATPDLIVSDVMMPRLDGFDLLRAVRADAALRETPVLLLSARAGEEARVSGLSSGADDYLTKPFSARELLARVSSNLQLSQLRRATERRLRDESRTLEILNQVGRAVSAELDLERAVQVVTDAATELTGAAFGAFFYNVPDDAGGSYRLHALSGASRETFERFPMPRNTAVFAPTFRGDGIVRSDDIRKDPRFGRNPPYHGMPEGHPAVRSYLAAPVISRTGEVLGGLFFGHPQPGVFTERAGHTLVGIAAQAAVAIDNARLYQAAQTEIAKRTRVQEDLRELNDSLERRVAETVADRDRLWELSEDLLMVASFDGVLERVSPSWQRTLGHAAPVLLGRSCLAFVHPDDLVAVTEQMIALRHEGVAVRYECRMARSDGSLRWVAWTLSLDPASGRIHGVGRDVSSDKDAAEALRHADEAMRMAQKMEAIGKLTGGVAHDFNNLLQVIGGNLQLLARDVAGEDRPEQHVRNALAGVARGAKLASQLLAFGRRQPLAPKVVNLGRLIRALDDMLRRALGDGIEIETVVAGGLWNTLVDPFQVENALLNLAINSRDAMDGHGKLTIEAGNAALDENYARRNAEVTPGQYVMVAVTDTGAGMSPEIEAQVFEPFFTTKPEGQGTGLGLSMVYGFVKQSGGHVKIYSEPGHGTTVRLYLPRVREEEDLETDVDGGPAGGGTETVLVVEDDEDVRATVVEMLASLGYRVLKARDALSALAIVESGVPLDLLFSDVVMPGPLRSTEMARKVRERLPGIAVLFTSGYTDNAIVHSGRLDEGIELLSKPYTQDALARKVRHVLMSGGAALPPDPLATKATGPRPGGGNVRWADGHPSGNPLGNTLGNTRILFVDDDDLVRASTAELLRTFGLEILEASNEVEALAILRTGAVDMLLTDVGLAGASGVELAVDARRLLPALRVVLVSGHDVALTPAQRTALPDAVTLRKPYALSDFINVLQGVGR
ncbi:GAF sensor hybrid histidine kinase [Cupriavidus sp. YR651]|uniref:response regulator n=1 Tax=Cupriavidus sp. YR651 TaxID=1855315 RepID=UPI00087EE697|nr:response regulator [Cupriavidus sp. YR651]SDD86291.1 GAF sensor hybrid histidine kinase [Cupriavidus sp. YR651]